MRISQVYVTRKVMTIIFLSAILAGCGAGRYVRDFSTDLYHKKTESIRLCKGVFLPMVYIEGGTFTMGSPLEEEGRRRDEQPSGPVTLDGFWIGQFEISQEQYYAVTGENPSRNRSDAYPVEQVSWLDAMEFCRTLSDMTGITFSLPTEAQWEYACRAGTLTPFAFGECLSVKEANYNGTLPLRGCEPGDVSGKAWNIGSGKPNDWGLYDMHGNVWEWCLDTHSGEYDPADTNNPVNIVEGRPRIIRGGCWSSDAANCRSASRYSAPQFASGEIVGFRVVVNP